MRGGKTINFREREREINYVEIAIRQIGESPEEKAREMGGGGAHTMMN